MLDKWLAAGRLAIKDMDLEDVAALKRCPHPDEGGLIFHTLRRAGVKPALFFVPRPDSRPFPACRE